MKYAFEMTSSAMIDIKSWSTGLAASKIVTVTRVEAGSNTSTVTLRVVRGDEMGLKKAAP
jgi:hypothetical protein